MYGTFQIIWFLCTTFRICPFKSTQKQSESQSRHSKGCTHALSTAYQHSARRAILNSWRFKYAIFSFSLVLSLYNNCTRSITVITPRVDTLRLNNCHHSPIPWLLIVSISLHTCILTYSHTHTREDKTMHLVSPVHYLCLHRAYKQLSPNAHSLSPLLTAPFNHNAHKLKYTHTRIHHSYSSLFQSKHTLKNNWRFRTIYALFYI